MKMSRLKTVRYGPARLLALLLTLWGLGFGGTGNASAAPDKGFSFDDVVGAAQASSRSPYKPPPPLPEALKQLGPEQYDAWRDIRFDTSQSIWRSDKLSFELQLFHPGFLYNSTVAINLVEGGKVHELRVGKHFFDYGRNRSLAEKLPEVVGAAGFRVHTPLNKKNSSAEFLVFLGASYFRAVAKGQRYGLSARGLALNTGPPGGEEFPDFREFWIVRPAPADKDVTIYALLDSPSVTGAYSFKVFPGVETRMDVVATLFLRQPVKKLGLAPLTSMFLYGENSRPERQLGWQPEIHDSDGLLLHLASGEWLWRPLQNPRVLRFADFEANDVRGFGLLQRDRDFHNYEDLETRYETRPSLWIEPAEAWGPGRVELLELPADKENQDNIVAYWIPDSQPVPGKPFTLKYTMHWRNREDALSPGAYVSATRISPLDGNTYQFVVDFQGRNLIRLDPRQEPAARISLGPEAQLVDQQMARNEMTKGGRLYFKIRFADKSALERMLPDSGELLDMRAFLLHGKDVLSETWSYAFKPRSGGAGKP